MLSITDTAFLIVVSVETLFGIFANGFIVVVHCLNYAEGRSLNSSDLFMLTLGLSNICLQCVEFHNVILFHIWDEIQFSNDASRVLNILLLYVVIFNFWLTAWLCVFYCVKIITWNHPLFLWLKIRISKVVPWLILGSALGSSFLSLPSYWYIYRGPGVSANNNLTATSFVEKGTLRWTPGYGFVCGSLGCCFPLLLVVLSIAFILASLSGHIRRMKQNASGFIRPNLQAHMKAATTIISLFFAYLALFLAVVSYMFLISGSISYGILFCYLVIFSYTPLQSFTLILGSAKLKQMSRKIFCLSTN